MVNYDEYKAIAGDNALSQDKFQQAISTDEGKRAFSKQYGAQILQYRKSRIANITPPEQQQQPVVHQDMWKRTSIENGYFELAANMWKGAGSFMQSLENMRRTVASDNSWFRKLPSSGTFQHLADLSMQQAKQLEQYGINPTLGKSAVFAKNMYDAFGYGITFAAKARTIGVSPALAIDMMGATDEQSTAQMMLKGGKGMLQGYMFGEVLKKFDVLKPYITEPLQTAIFTSPMVVEEMQKPESERDWDKVIGYAVGDLIYGSVTNPGVHSKEFRDQQLGVKALTARAKELLGEENYYMLRKNAQETLRIINESPEYETPQQAVTAFAIRQQAGLRSHQAVVYRSTGEATIISMPEGSRLVNPEESFVYDWTEHNVPLIANKVYTVAEAERVAKKRAIAEKAAANAGKTVDLTKDEYQPRPWGMNSQAEITATMEKVSGAIRDANGDWEKLPKVVQDAIKSIDTQSITPSEGIKPMFDGTDGFQFLGGKVGKTDEPMRLRSGEPVGLKYKKADHEMTREEYDQQRVDRLKYSFEVSPGEKGSTLQGTHNAKAMRIWRRPDAIAGTTTHELRHAIAAKAINGSQEVKDYLDNGDFEELGAQWVKRRFAKIALGKYSPAKRRREIFDEITTRIANGDEEIANDMPEIAKIVYDNIKLFRPDVKLVPHAAVVANAIKAGKTIPRNVIEQYPTFMKHEKTKVGEPIVHGADWTGERYIKVKLPAVGYELGKADKEYVIDLMGAAENFLAHRGKDIRGMKRTSVEKVVEQLRKAYQNGKATPEMIAAAMKLRRDVYMNVNAAPDEIMIQRINKFGNPEPGLTNREVSQMMLMRDMPVMAIKGKTLPQPFKANLYKFRSVSKWFTDNFYRTVNTAEADAIVEAKTISNEFYKLRDNLKKNGAADGSKLEWGWEDRIGAHLISKQEWTGSDGKKHTGMEILKDLDVKPPGELNAAEQEIAGFMREQYNYLFKFVNNGRKKAGLPEFEYMDNYFTLMSVVSNLDRQQIDLQTLPKSKIQQYIKKDATPFPFLERGATGVESAVDFNVERVFTSYTQTALRHGHLAPHIAKQQAMMKPLKARNGQVMFDMKEENPVLYTEWKKWLDYITKGNDRTFENWLGVGGKNFDNWLLKRQRNIVTATLGFALQSSLNQCATIKHALVTESPTVFAKGIMRYAGNLLKQIADEGIISYSKAELKRRQHESMLVSNARKFSFETRAREADIIMRDQRALERKHGEQLRPRYEIHEKSAAARKEKAAEKWEAVKRLAFVGLSSIDAHVADAMWEVYYEGGMQRYNDHGRAVRYADDLIKVTAGSTLSSDVTTAQRSTLGKIATTFQTFLIAEWNFLTHELTGSKESLTRYSSTFDKVVKFALATAFMNYLYEDVLGLYAPYPAPINHAIDAMEEGKESTEIAGIMAGELLSTVPVVGPAATMNSSSAGALIGYFDDMLSVVGKGELEKVPYLAARYYGIPGSGQVRKMIMQEKYAEDKLSEFPFDWNRDPDFSFKYDSYFNSRFKSDF